MLWLRARFYLLAAGVYLGYAFALERDRIERRREVIDLELTYAAPSAGEAAD